MFSTEEQDCAYYVEAAFCLPEEKYWVIGTDTPSTCSLHSGVQRHVSVISPGPLKIGYIASEGVVHGSGPLRTARLPVMNHISGSRRSYVGFLAQRLNARRGHITKVIARRDIRRTFVVKEHAL